MKRRIGSWIGAVLVLAAPARADVLEVPPYTAVPPCIERSGEPVIGTVTAITGAASIASPGCAPVAAECGSALHAGQQLVTGAGGGAALMAGSHYVQVAEGSAVTVGTTDTGATRVVVERGSARVMDVGSGPGAGAEVATAALESRDPGADVVASASEKGSSICSYADPIDVRQGDRTTSVPAGDCIATPGFTPPSNALAGTTGGAASVAAIPVSIGGVSRCDVAVGDPGPPPVASGPTRIADVDPPPVVPPPFCVGGSCSPPPPPPPVCCRGIAEQPVIFEPPPD